MELSDEVFADFDLLLPSQVLDESGAFLEDTTVLDSSSVGQGGEEKIESEGKQSEGVDVKAESRENAGSGSESSKKGGSTGKRTSNAATADAKKAKRRRQIAAASRASRARRKRELEDLREENKVSIGACKEGSRVTRCAETPRRALAVSVKDRGAADEGGEHAGARVTGHARGE